MTRKSDDDENPIGRVIIAGGMSGVIAGILSKTGIDIDPISLAILIINKFSEAATPVQEGIQSSAFSQNILSVDLFTGILVIVGLGLFISTLIYAVLAFKKWYFGLILYGIAYFSFFYLIVWA